MHLLQRLHSRLNSNAHTKIALGKLIHTNISYINLKISNIKCIDYILWQ